MTKDIPAGVIAVGNPCKVKRKITDKDIFVQFKELLEANSKVVQKNPSHCLCGKIILQKAANSVWLIHTEAEQSIIARLAIMKVITQDVSHPCWMKH